MKTIKRKYPKIAGEKLDAINRKKFDGIYREIIRSLEFDIKENKLEVSDNECIMMAWNLATNLFCYM